MAIETRHLQFTLSTTAKNINYEIKLSYGLLHY